MDLYAFMHFHNTLNKVAYFAHSEVIHVSHLVLITCSICFVSGMKGLKKLTIIQSFADLDEVEIDVTEVWRHSAWI